MLNAGHAVDDDVLKVLDESPGAVGFKGEVNTSDDQLLANVRSNIRRGHPQVKQQREQMDRIALVGGGPSLDATLPELRDLIFDGAKLVTLNGAYHWCIANNLQPKMQVVMDARPSNVRFVSPASPKCVYLLASQCDPSLFDAVADYPDVWIFHAAAGSDGPLRELLDDYYCEKWFGIGGGTTVAMRALWLLRHIGFTRIDLFGIDSCFMDGKGHAYDQPENDGDRKLPFRVCPADRPDLARTFIAAPWMAKQAEDLIQAIKVNGNHFDLAIHGDGMLRYALESYAQSAQGDVAIAT